MYFTCIPSLEIIRRCWRAPWQRTLSFFFKVIHVVVCGWYVLNGTQVTSQNAKGCVHTYPPALDSIRLIEHKPVGRNKQKKKKSFPFLKNNGWRLLAAPPPFVRMKEKRKGPWVLSLLYVALMGMRIGKGEGDERGRRKILKKRRGSYR